MIRKVRLGVLQGAVLSDIGMKQIEKSVLVLNLPFLFKSNEEFNFIFLRLKPIFENKVESNGFKIVQWTQSGWIYCLSNGSVSKSSWSEKYKISITKDGPELEEIWGKMGFKAVLTDPRDTMIALESGVVSALYMPAVMAVSSQLFAIASHTLAPKLSFLVGSLLLNKRTWEQIS